LVVDGAPRLSPDALRVAFVRRTRSLYSPAEVYVAAIDGNGRRRVGAGFDPRWAPDGTMIAYSGDDGRIHVADLAYGKARAVAVGDSPVWSADRRLAFTRHSWRTEYDDAGNLEMVLVSSELWVSNADGTGARLLRGTSASPGDDPAIWSPAWSPDGTTVAATTSSAIVLFNAEDGRLVAAFPASNQNVSWSPDGGALAFSDVVGVHVVDVQTGHVETVANHSSGVSAPTWSPDGSRLAFTGCTGSVEASVCDVFSVGRDGTALTRLTKTHRIVDGTLDWR
jgi:Tol biopolymer transport system component